MPLNLILDYPQLCRVRAARARGAEANPLPQVVQSIKMLFPDRVECLDQEAFFDQAHRLGPEHLLLVLDQLARSVKHPLPQSNFIDPFFAAPGLDRKIDAQNAP